MTVLAQINEELKEKFESANPLRERESMEDNPIGLDKEVAASLARDLNSHQASLFVLSHQYQKHHWLVEGPQFRDLHLYLEDQYNAIHKDLDAIAERMTVLGGIPTSSPTALAREAYIRHEPEGYFALRDMLNHDLKAERAVCVTLRKTIAKAMEGGDYGTETLLRQVLAAAEDRAHHMEHYLADDSLIPAGK